MKQMQVCLSAMEDRQNSFHHRGVPVRLVQACLYVVKPFYPPRRCCEVRVQACSSAREVRESSFH